MLNSRRLNRNRKVQSAQVLGRSASGGPDNSRPDPVWNFLNLAEAREVFGLDWWQIYAAAKRGEVHPLQRNGAGRVYYPEWELEALASSIRDCLGTHAA